MNEIGVRVPATYVFTYVYVRLTDPNGSEHIRHLVYPHDGVAMAVTEALAHFDGLVESGWRIREVWTRSRVEPVVSRRLEAREL